MDKRLSWGRYPAIPQTPHDIAWRSQFRTMLNQMQSDHGETLAYGMGRSYGDSCLATSNHVIDTSSLDRLIEVDWNKGILRAESGLTLGEILTLSIPKGWFLPVTPGTQFVTLGGAVANDVHGKNHHVRGTFGCNVTQFKLVRSDRTPVICTPKKNTELFKATIGGLGLTGLIEWVEIKLIPISSNRMLVDEQPFTSLDEFFALSKEYDQSHDYTVAWVDCLNKNGRGIFSAGNHAPSGELTIQHATKLKIPFTPPLSAVNKLSLKAFNELYYHSHKSPRKEAHVYYEPFFYPLDSILEWNRMYGTKGFQQFQCVIPGGEDEAAMREILKIISQSGKGSFLAVMKKCGAMKSPGLLSFPIPGTSLALDFPNTKGLETQLLSKLDDVVRESGGRLYPAKDVHMSALNFKKFYPLWETVEKLRDPALCSRFWRRVSEI